jgi:hypothetical protein
MDLLSRCDIMQSFVYKTQSYDMAYQYQFMPAFMFKKYCADEKRHIKSRPVRVLYPTMFRDMKNDIRKNTNIFESLLDLKPNNDNERYKIGGNSAVQSLIRRKDMMFDVLPWIYLMVHPDVREINLQLFNDQEKHIFLKAIEFLVLFDIKIKIQEQSGANGPEPTFRLHTQTTSNNDKTYIPKFEPDIAQVVTFGNHNSAEKDGSATSQRFDTTVRHSSGRLQYMRLKTQLLINQNYEIVKQTMLVGKDTY